MPSVLAQQPPSIISTKLDFLDLGFDGNLDHSFSPHKARANGHSISQNQQPLAHFVDERSDQSSRASNHVSELSDLSPAPPNTNGDRTRPTSMSSLPNGRRNSTSVPPSSQHDDGSFDHAFGHAKAVQPTVVGDSTPPSEANYQHLSTPIMAPQTANEIERRLSLLLSASQRQSLTESFPDMDSKGPADITNTDAPSPHLLTTFPSDSFSYFNTTPSVDPSPRLLSPEAALRRNVYGHRFSSPPAYNSPTSNSIGSPTGQPSASGSLRQRHTLEVPKQQAVRSFKDSGTGTDLAMTSGRFSPTGAGRRPSINLVGRNTRSMHSEVPRDEIVPDEEAVRWAEAYRHKIASNRRRREELDDDKVLVGVKVDEHHANWVTAYNMLTGIRVSVSRTNAKLNRPLTEADFHAKQKSIFDVAGNELVPSAKYDFKFKDYAPWVFRHLRSHFHLDPADYLMSLTGKYILSELGSPGKSGGFFYFSRDYKYIIKTIHHSEHKFLRKILKNYYQHITENPNTLLSQFYGLHRVKIRYSKKIHFVVMNNLFPPHRDIHMTFDLKGSTVGREYREEKMEGNQRATLKDLNWLRRQRHIELGQQKKRIFLDQLRRDVALLTSLEIIDYSILIGIHDLRRGNDENLRDKTLQVFNPGGDECEGVEDQASVLLRTPSKLESVRKAKELRHIIRSERPIPMGQTTVRMPDEWAAQEHASIFCQDEGGFRATHQGDSPADELYYLGVIDCLTHYGFVKKAEHFFKGLVYDSQQISALPPNKYGDRFFHFIEGITLSAEEVATEREKAALGPVEKEGGKWGSSGRRRSAINYPPMPDYPAPPVPPPVPPVNVTDQQWQGNQQQQQWQEQEESSDQLISPKAQEVVELAMEEANKHGFDGTREESIPTLIRSTVTCPTSTASSHAERRHTAQSAQLDITLPVVEEATEASSTDTGIQCGQVPPKTPPGPTTSTYFPQQFNSKSADSGYAVTASPTTPKGRFSPSRDGSPNRQLTRTPISRESLYKKLPPIPIPSGDRT